MESFEKFLLSLDTEKDLIEATTSSNLSEHHKAELETLQKEIDCLQESANKTDINTEDVENVRSRSEHIVKELDITEHQVHTMRQKSLKDPLAETNAETIIHRANKAMSQDILNFDSTLVVLPIVEAANKIKTRIIKEVVDAAESLDHRGFILEFNNIVAKRSRKENLIIERDACFTLHSRNSKKVDSLREAEAILLDKKKDLYISLTESDSNCNILKAENIKSSEKISSAKEAIINAKKNCEMQNLKYQETFEALEKTKKCLAHLAKEISLKNEKIAEIKSKAATEESDSKKRKAAFQQRISDTKNQMTITLANLQQKKISLLAEIDSSLKNVTRYFTIQERISRSEVQRMQHSHKILAYQEHIRKTKEELASMKSRTEAYRMESERKIAQKRSELDDMKKATESKRTQLDSKKAELAISETRLLEKLGTCDQLRDEISNAMEHEDIFPMDMQQFQPIFSSTPRVTTRSTSRRKTRAETSKKSRPARETKPARGRRGKK